MKNRLLLLFAAAAVAACGVTGKPAVQKIKVPTQAEADSIMALGNAAVFVVEKAEGPVIYAFDAYKDSALIDVHCQVVEKNAWTRNSLVTYPCGEEFNLPLLSKPDSASVRNIAGTDYLTFRTARGNGERVQNTVFLFNTDTENLYNVSYSGKRRSDGKYYGQTDLSMQDNNNLPQMIWADSLLRSDTNYKILTDEEVMSDQAIDWWLEKNPTAMTKAIRINFGSLPPECSLVQQYKKARKESSETFRAALFDTVDYTVIVAQNRSTGAYILAWVEPRCMNKKTDRLLNSIYFSNGSRLSLFYYKGSRTFKYNLSLASGQIQR